MPSVLAFERNLDISDAIFSQCSSTHPEKEERPLLIREKSIRGTISNRLKNAIANDPVKLDAEIQKANLQTVDVVTLHTDYDTLIVRYTLKALPFSGTPCTCNDAAYQEKLLAVIKNYLEQHGTRALALRYATNIANARWLWRNRMGAEHIRISVHNPRDSERTITIDNALALSLNDFPQNHEGINQIADWLQAGLEGQRYTLLHIEARAKIGKGQEAYPSQELILDKGKNDKSKVLYRLDEVGTAGMHSQKIGNAIRTIDNWYPNAQFPIAIEPYGAVTTLGTAFRQPKQKNDFYTLFDKWILENAELPLEQQHYIIAVLIRGGVFGDKKE